MFDNLETCQDTEMFDGLLSTNEQTLENLRGANN